MCSPVLGFHGLIRRHLHFPVSLCSVKSIEVWALLKFGTSKSTDKQLFRYSSSFHCRHVSVHTLHSTSLQQSETLSSIPSSLWAYSSLVTCSILPRGFPSFHLCFRCTGLITTVKFNLALLHKIQEWLLVLVGCTRSWRFFAPIL